MALKKSGSSYKYAYGSLEIAKQNLMDQEV
jgi:hypothetical protein